MPDADAPAKPPAPTAAAPVDAAIGRGDFQAARRSDGEGRRLLRPDPLVIAFYVFGYLTLAVTFYLAWRR